MAPAFVTTASKEPAAIWSAPATAIASTAHACAAADRVTWALAGLETTARSALVPATLPRARDVVFVILAARHAAVLRAGLALAATCLTAWVVEIVMGAGNVLVSIRIHSVKTVSRGTWVLLAMSTARTARKSRWTAETVSATTAIQDTTATFSALVMARARPFRARIDRSVNVAQEQRAMAGGDRCVIRKAALVLARTALVTVHVTWLHRNASVLLAGLVLAARPRTAAAPLSARGRDSATGRSIRPSAPTAPPTGWGQCATFRA